MGYYWISLRTLQDWGHYGIGVYETGKKYAILQDRMVYPNFVILEDDEFDEYWSRLTLDEQELFHVKRRASCWDALLCVSSNMS